MQVISNQVAYLSKSSIVSEQPHTFECVHVICALKHNTGKIRLSITSAVS